MKRLLSYLPLLAFIAIILFAWLTRIYHLGFPSGFVFDEQYHVPAIKLMVADDPRAFEWWHQPLDGSVNYDWLHPPMAKYIEAQFYVSFGEDAYAWRLASVVFGVIGIGLVFVIAQLAFEKITISLLAAFLLSLDGLWLVQSRIAMNDVFVTVWLLAATLVYMVYQRLGRLRLLPFVGLLFGVALATKWSAGFWLTGILSWELIGVYRKKTYKTIPWLFFSLVIVPLAVYLASYLPMFADGKSFSYFIKLHQQIISYQLYAGTTHLYQSQPWQWLLNLRPVWYWTGGEGQNIYALNNPLLAWLELGAVIFSIKSLWQRKKFPGNKSLAFLLMIFAVSFLPWISSPRITFYYHFTPATPLAAILLAFWVYQIYLKKSNQFLRLALFFVLVSLVWVFWTYYPHWIGLPVSENFAEAIYFALPSWR